MLQFIGLDKAVHVLSFKYSFSRGLHRSITLSLHWRGQRGRTVTHSPCCVADSSEYLQDAVFGHLGPAEALGRGGKNVGTRITLFFLTVLGAG